MNAVKVIKIIQELIFPFQSEFINLIGHKNIYFRVNSQQATSIQQGSSKQLKGKIFAEMNQQFSLNIIYHVAIISYEG